MSALLGGIVWSIQALGKLALGVLSVSYQCGSVIVSCGQAVFQTAFSIISTLAEVVSILYKDFCVFSYDLFSKVVDVASFCASLVSGLFSGAKSTFLTARDAILFVVNSLTEGLDCGFNTVSQGWEKVLDFAELLKWCVVMLGHGCWFAVQLVPLCVVYFIFNLLSLIGMMLSEILDRLQSAVMFFSDKSVLSYNWCFNFLTDFPVEALLGIITAASLTFCMHRNRSAIQTSSTEMVRWTAQLVRSIIGTVWYMLVRCLNFNWGRRSQHLNYESDEDTPLALRLVYRKRKSQSPGVLKRQLMLEQEEKLCVVCLTNNKCVILMPCRHLCMCTDCSDVIDNTSRSCPICRTDFDRRVTVYM